MLDLSQIIQIRQKITAVIVAAEPTLLPDTLKEIAAIVKCVAAGGADPVAIVQAFETLNQIYADLSAAEKAVQG